MKKIVAILIIYVVTIPAYADDWKTVCASFGGLAVTIMENRQSGVSMSKMMEVMADPKIRDTAESLIISAFDSPRYSAEKMQKRSVEEFRDKVYLECAKAMRTKKKKD